MRAAVSVPARRVWCVVIALLASSCSSGDSTHSTIPVDTSGTASTTATSTGTGSTDSVPTSTTGSDANGDLRVVGRDESSVTVAATERFVIELPSNATTGYAWEMTVADGAVVHQVDHTYVAPDSGAVGAGGWERFTYEAGDSGTTRIDGEYRRSFEPGIAPADTVSFEIRVEAATSTSSGTTVPTSSVPDGQAAWPAIPDTPAGNRLATFLSAAQRLHDGVQPLIVEASQVEAGAELPATVAQHAAGALDEFDSLVALFPSGLDPSIDRATIDLLFTLGRELAPFLFAPGWEFDGWDAWAPGVESARVQVPIDVATVVELATAHPDAAAEHFTDIDAAALHGGLEVLLARAFGHANFDTQPPWSIRWIGGLTAGDGTGSQPTCSDAGRPVTTGQFVDGLGGCAVLYYDTADPSAHDAELDSWLADPSSVPSFRGEVVTIRWTNGRWIGIGSAE